MGGEISAKTFKDNQLITYCIIAFEYVYLISIVFIISTRKKGKMHENVDISCCCHDVGTKKRRICVGITIDLL